MGAKESIPIDLDLVVDQRGPGALAEMAKSMLLNPKSIIGDDSC